MPVILPIDTRHDKELIALLKSDNERAVSEIFTQHYAFLCRAIIRVVKDAHIAEDLAQDVFYDLWKRRHELDISTSVRAYLRRAGINKTLNYIRDKKIKWDDEDHLSLLVSDGPSAPQLLEGKDLEALIEKTIDGMPERCRLIFTLSRFEEMSYKEIAGALNISVKTVENQISKALRILRRVLGEVANDP